MTRGARERTTSAACSLCHFPSACRNFTYPHWPVLWWHPAFCLPLTATLGHSAAVWCIEGYAPGRRWPCWQRCFVHQVAQHHHVLQAACMGAVRRGLHGSFYRMDCLGWVSIRDLHARPRTSVSSSDGCAPSLCSLASVSTMSRSTSSTEGSGTSNLSLYLTSS